jgi:dTDP-4-amino-4,6-dideoxygalactose transaminase
MYSSMPVTNDISKRILCLPLYVELRHDEVLKIINIINK